jgi:adenylyltransferase/sulfurtransferase
MAELSDADLERYGRQVLLPQLGVEGQQHLAATRVLLLGAGGLGAPAALYLAGAGVGQLTIADGDTVDRSNLHRQVIHAESRLGWNKAESAAAALGDLNPGVAYHPLPVRLEGPALESAVAEADLVVDASDNFATRFAVNAACHQAPRDLVSGAVIRWEGQVAVFPFGREPDTPCYQCLYRDPPDAEDSERCAVTGVLGPAAGLIGTAMATEAIKAAAGIEAGLAARLLIADTLHMDFRTLDLASDPACPTCSGSPAGS